MKMCFLIHSLVDSGFTLNLQYFLPIIAGFELSQYYILVVVVELYFHTKKILNLFIWLNKSLLCLLSLIHLGKWGGGLLEVNLITSKC